MNERLENYQIAITYRCNWHCRWCYEFFDVLPTLGPESDVTEEDIVLAAAALRAAGVRANKISVTGGETTLHPKLIDLYRTIREQWKSVRPPHTFSNLSLPNSQHLHQAFPKGVRMRGVDAAGKLKAHHPVMVSPADMGLPPLVGFSEKVGQCEQQASCGRCFDAFGFSACPYAAPLGRLFGIDVHSVTPVSFASVELCRHCLHSRGRKNRNAMLIGLKEGTIGHPTATYAAALEKRRLEGYVPIKKFVDRVKETQCTTIRESSR